MIGVAENDLRLDFVMEVAICNTFHAANRTDRHEDGRLNLSVVGRDETCSGIRERVGMFKFKLHILNHNVPGWQK